MSKFGTETNVVPSFAKDILTADGLPAIHVRTANGYRQRTSDGALKRAAKSYVVTDPGPLMDKLQAAGFRVGKMVQFRSSWRFGLEVIFPAADCGPGAAYWHRAKILCGNTGREALQICPGALRLACMNQFHGDAIRIRHTDPDLVKFLDDPVTPLFDMRSLMQGVADTVESFRGIRLGTAYGFALTAGGHPRLGVTATNWLRNYRARHGEVGKPWVDAWDLVQALTETKKPTAIKAADVLIRNADTVRAGGRVEEYFKIWEPKSETAPEVDLALSAQ